MDKETRFYDASTCELYGFVQEVPQKETTPVLSALALRRRKALWLLDIVKYTGFFRATASCFNHESPIRGGTFATRKISRGVARIQVGLEQTLYLGNLEANRDWGHAKDD